MKLFLKIAAAFLAIFLLVGGVLGYFIYKNKTSLRDMTAHYLAKSTPNAMESAAQSFLDSCVKSAKEEFQKTQNVTPEVEGRIHSFCDCSKDEFKKVFTSEEVMKIGLGKMMAQKIDLPNDKIQKIVDTCKAKLKTND